MANWMRAVVLAWAGCAAWHGSALADEYDEAYKRVGAVKTIASYGTDLFGDRVNLYDGGLEFVQPDISLPGNNALPVAAGRRLIAGTKISVSSTNPTGSFGDWQLEVPHIHGTFSSGVNKGWATTKGTYTRCTNFGVPIGGTDTSGTYGAFGESFWHGTFLYVPGQGDQEMVKRSAANPTAPGGNTSKYPIVTHGGYQVACGINLVNGQGEGFVVVSPEGVTYRFDTMMKWYSPNYPISPGSAELSGRKRRDYTPSAAANPSMLTAEYWIVPSTVTDRFGNTVSYNWDSSDARKLNSIVASDGRRLDFSYSGSPIVTQISDGSRVWKYGYTSGYLTSVQLPDGSGWSYNLGALEKSVSYSVSPSSCESVGTPNSSVYTGTISHPSGATGTFQMGSVNHGRAKVPKVCLSKGGSPTESYSQYPRYFAQLSLKSKQITGPGLAGLSWAYSYPTAVGSWDNCTSNCGGTKTVRVTDGQGRVTDHTFGTVWSVNDGQLLTMAEGDGSTVLRTTTTTYAAWADGGGQPFPKEIGFSDAEGDHFATEQFTPERERAITLQGVTFKWHANAYDAFARAIDVTKSSTLGYSRRELYGYQDFTNLWVLGRLNTVTDAANNQQMEGHWYDTLARKTSDYEFGFWRGIYTYNADGTMATVTDGAQDAHKIKLTDYYRGVPRTITYPDARIKKSVVNGYGKITSLTDEAGYITNYAYDALGRLKQITYPNDTVSYSPTVVTFAQSTGSEYGVPAGHWVQRLTTGSLVEENYFDGLWRPIISRRYDSTNVAGTSRFTVRSFDEDGQPLFESYPMASLTTWAGQYAGTSTLRDALGRPYQILASSELGTLKATIDYLSGFKTRTTNPRSLATTVSYQAYDQPVDSWPVSLAGPLYTNNITRNNYGNALIVTRSGSFQGSTLQATTNYVYDKYFRLCKVITPGGYAEVQSYDAAGNVAWHADGQSLSSTTDCQQGSVSATAKTSYGYDSRNRLLTTSYGDGATPNITRTLTPDGLPDTVTKGATAWSYDYNARRLLTTEALTVGSNSYAFTHVYDSLGNTSGLVYPNGTTLNFSPNAFGEATAVGSHVTGVTRYPNGAVSGYSYGNGIKRTVGLNGRYLLQSIKDTGASTPINDSYAYDPNANIASITDSARSGLTTRSMAYDNADRLTGVTSSQQWGAASYTFDPLDNIRTMTRQNQNITLGYNGANRISGLTVNGQAWAVQQDDGGRVTQRGPLVLSWDQEDRLTGVTGPATVGYQYDGLGRRALVTNADGSRLITVYGKDGQLFYKQSLAANGQVSNTTLHAYLDGKLVAEVSNGVVAYVHTDGLGSAVARTNSSAALTQQVQYDPWGDGWAGTNPSAVGYAGHHHDVATDLVQMQQRYYDPLIGRFLSPDPEPTNANTGENFNRYWYANNNPYRYTDPDGRCPICPIILPLVGVGLAANEIANSDVPLVGGGAAKLGAASLEKFAGEAAAESEKVLYRRGASDSKALLTRDAEAAEKVIGIHGVSTSTSSAAKPGQVVRSATSTELEKNGFAVTQTGKDPNHHTVALPKPITYDLVRLWNELFK